MEKYKPTLCKGDIEIPGYGVMKDALVYLRLEAEIALNHQKYKRCLSMARWCEATALWCYQAANTLPTGFHATLYGKNVMIEPARLYKRFALLTKWSNRWLNLAKKFKENKNA